MVQAMAAPHRSQQSTFPNSASSPLCQRRRGANATVVFESIGLRPVGSPSVQTRSLEGVRIRGVAAGDLRRERRAIHDRETQLRSRLGGGQTDGPLSTFRSIVMRSGHAAQELRTSALVAIARGLPFPTFGSCSVNPYISSYPGSPGINSM